MKETTPKLTPKKKQEAKKWIEYIYQNTGIKFTCRKIKDYIFIKMLYLLLVDYIEEENEFVINIMKNYVLPRNNNRIYKANYFGYSFEDIIRQYIVKYYYGDLTNFAVIWEYYNDLVEGEFEKELTRGEKVLSKKLDKDATKMNHLFDNFGVLIIEQDTIATFEELTNELSDEHDIELIWRTQRDREVCEECAKLSGKRFIRAIDLPSRHPNCRCYYEIYVDGELFTSHDLLDII